MVKKKTTEEPISIGNDSEEQYKALMKDLNSTYYNGIIREADSLNNRHKHIYSVSPIIDNGLGGGIPEGCWVSLSGLEKAGKTVTALQMAADAQKAGRRTFYLNIEERLNEKTRNGIKGLDLEKLKVIGSEKGNILNTVDYLNIAEKIVKTVEGSFVIFDSLSAMCPPSIMENGIGTSTFGSANQLLAQFCDICAPIVPINGCTLVGIIHFYANTSGYGKKYNEKVAQRWKYQSDVKMTAYGFQPWFLGGNKDGERIGQIVNWEINHSALGPPGAKIDSYIRYGIGIDCVYESIIMARDLGLIEASGSWLNLNFLPEPVKFQGVEKTCDFLQNNPEALSALMAQLKV